MNVWHGHLGRAEADTRPPSPTGRKRHCDKTRPQGKSPFPKRPSRPVPELGRQLRVLGQQGTQNCAVRLVNPVRVFEVETASRGATSCQKPLAARGWWRIVTCFPRLGGPTVKHFGIHATATRRPRFWERAHPPALLLPLHPPHPTSSSNSTPPLRLFSLTGSCAKLAAAQVKSQHCQHAEDCCHKQRVCPKQNNTFISLIFPQCNIYAE